jgi:hypothetical protein
VRIDRTGSNLKVHGRLGSLGQLARVAAQKPLAVRLLGPNLASATDVEDCAEGRDALARRNHRFDIARHCDG